MPNKNEESPERIRQQAYEEMPAELQKIAEQIDKKFQTLNKGSLKIFYDIGVLIDQVINDEATYGPDAVKLLVDHFGISDGERTLYDLRCLATEYTREYVAEVAATPMKDGHYISRYHLITLAKIHSQRKRRKILKRVLHESLSVAELQQLLHDEADRPARESGGGRKLKPPPTPSAGLRRLTRDAERMTKYVELLDEQHVFKTFEEMPPGEVDEKLIEQVQQAEVGASRAAQHLQHAMQRLQEGRARLERVVALRQQKHEQGQHAKVKAG